MRNILALSLAFCLGLCLTSAGVRADDANDKAASEATEKEREQIQGTWEPSSLSFGGKASPTPPKELPTRIFTGDKLTTKDPGKKAQQEATFKLDVGKEPKHIDMTDKKDGTTVHGIYVLEGDTLKIAYRFPAAGWPTTFDGKDVFLETLQRQTKK